MPDPEWSTACPDWERRIVAGESLIPFPPLFPDEAQEALDLFGTLRIVDAAGSPTMAEVARPWVTEFVAAIFGAYNPETGRRLINEFLLLISKKNGKSTIAAGIMLTALILNWRKSGEFIILAPTKEVADNSFKPIRDMIDADEEIEKLIHVQEHMRTVTHRTTKATLKVVAADSDTVSGKKAIGVFVDELHEFGKKAKASNMLLEATGGLASRPEGFVIYATTQSEQPPAGVFKQKLDYARKVRDGEIVNRRFLPVLYEFPRAMVESKAYQDLENAYITNPNWGVSVDIERIQQLHEEYTAGGSEKYLEFAAKHLNVEAGLNLRNDRWPGADYWVQRAETGLTLDALLDRSEVVVAGVDGGGLDDLLGLAVIGRERGTGNWLVWNKAWAHPSVLERRKEIAPRLHDFAADGDLTLVDNIGEDVADLAEILAGIHGRNLFPAEHAIGLDRIGISFEEPFAEADIPDSLLIGIVQGFKLAGTIKTVERKLAEGTMSHAGQPMMAWCVGNAKVEQRGNAIVISKQISGTAKIDPLLALFNAAQLMALNPAGRGRSFWENL